MPKPDWYQADDDDSDRARSNTAVWRDRGAIIAQQQTRIAQLEAQIARVEALADDWVTTNETGHAPRETYHFMAWSLIRALHDSIPEFTNLRASLTPKAHLLNCPVCGSGEEGDCICDQAEAIAKAHWEEGGRAIYEAPWEQVSPMKRQHLIRKALPEVLS